MTTSTNTTVPGGKDLGDENEMEKIQTHSNKSLVDDTEKNADKSTKPTTQPVEPKDPVSSTFIESLERITQLVSSLRSDLSSAHSLAAQSTSSFVPRQLLSLDVAETDETNLTPEPVWSTASSTK